MTERDDPVRLSASQIANEKSEAENVARRGARSMGIGSIGILFLAFLGLVYTLYFGKDLILPVVLALVLQLLLRPAHRFLTESLHLPKALAAALIIVAVFGAIASIALAVSIPAVDWIQRAPESLPILKEKIAVLRKPIEYLQNTLSQIESVAAPMDLGDVGQTITVKEPSTLPSYLASGTAEILSGFLTTIVVLFFLLVGGQHLLRGFADVLPRHSGEHQAMEIATEIQKNITGYLLTVTMMNTLVGIATGAAMWACGLSTPLLWGATAFLLNYIPVLGPMTAMAIFFLAGVLTFPSAWYALVPTGIYLLIHIAEGETITPMLLARRFTLNPVVVIVSLFFWHMIWGVPGVLLAVPLLAMLKIFCDHIEPLKPLGHIIGS